MKSNSIVKKVFKSVSDFATIIISIVVFMVLFDKPAFAGPATTTPSNLTLVICGLVNTIAVDILKGLATLAIMGVGIAAMLGKATWTQALTVAVGIGMMWSAPLTIKLLTANIGTLTSKVPCSGITSGGGGI